MINVKDKRCKNESCQTLGYKKYRGYCSFCFQHLFPTDPLTFQISCKTKEIALRDYINTHFNGFHHDEPLWVGECDCSIRRRIDHRVLIYDTLLCVETDEHQNQKYDKEDEIARYHDI